MLFLFFFCEHPQRTGLFECVQGFISKTSTVRWLWQIAKVVQAKEVCAMNPKRSVRPLDRRTRIPKKTLRTLLSDGMELMYHVSLNIQ